MTTPAKYDIEIYQGDTFKLPFQIEIDEDPKDSTGSTWKGELRSINGELAAEFNIDVIDAAITDIEVTLDSTQTSQLNPQLYYVFDIQETTAGGEIQTWIKGNVTVISEVTQV